MRYLRLTDWNLVWQAASRLISLDELGRSEGGQHATGHPVDWHGARLPDRPLRSSMSNSSRSWLTGMQSLFDEGEE